MKTLFFLLLCLHTALFAQYTETSGQLWTKYSLGKVDTAIYNNFSIGGEVLVGERWGLNYNFDLVFRNDNIFQMHSSAGLIGGPFLIGLGIASWAAAGDSDGDGEKDANLGALGIIGGLIILALPEGVSYHIPVRYNWDIAPYVNILGVDYMKNRNTDQWYLRYAATFGTRVTYWNPKRYTLNTFFETRKVAGMGWALGGGFGVGYTLE
ncbi:MAG: hypothetical protein K0R65_1954 [Crocinitomicaceae bacterium]|jgi:hypothetical protein|nr:hypothetical protein [Crocinitomicaceae bacterium]